MGSDSLTALQRDAGKPQLCVVKDIVLLREAREGLSEEMAIKPEEKQELTMERRDRANALWQEGACGKKKVVRL